MENDISQLSANIIKKNIQYAAIPEAEKWRIGVVKDMMNICESDNYGAFSLDEALDFMQFACSS